MYDRAWPRWLWSYTVGPHTYIRMSPPPGASIASLRRLFVLYTRIVTGVAGA
jgi:hypothetical protein